MLSRSSRYPLPFWLRLFLGMGIIFAGLFLFLWLGWPARADRAFPDARYGITWSPSYARYLGISSEEGLRAAVRDLGVRHVRLSTEWSALEPMRGQFDWIDLDRHLDLLATEEIPVTLAIGYKTPRWPECSHPAWANHLSQSEREDALRFYLSVVIAHVRMRPEIVAWQVENEPFFPFGACQPRRKEDIIREYDFVRALDPYEPYQRPLMVTDSGELGAWLPPSGVIDAIGFSVYRVTDNPFFGVRTYDWLPPWWYFRKMLLLRLITGKNYYISEFQMEPWILSDLKTASVEEMFATFPIERMRLNHWQLQRVRFPRIDLWGAEWWYWMKAQKQHPEFWEEARQIFAR